MTSVAVVEDDAILRKTLTALIGEAPGFRCVGAFGTAEEALKRIPGLMPDVVVMDIHLPSKSGIECTCRLKESCPAVRILMLTVYDDSERIFEALRAGANGYLLKRSVAEDILPAILDVKEGKAPMSAQVARKVLASFRQPPRGVDASSDLSEREKEILDQLSQGYSNKEIAARLSVSLATVCTHLRHIYDKLHVHSRTEALARMRPLTADSGPRIR
jgi:DNA-binding NarL/FixJ family response regulator